MGHQGGKIDDIENLVSHAAYTLEYTRRIALLCLHT